MLLKTRSQLFLRRSFSHLGQRLHKLVFSVVKVLQRGADLPIYLAADFADFAEFG